MIGQDLRVAGGLLSGEGADSGSRLGLAAALSPTLRSLALSGSQNPRPRYSDKH